jgi:hypothetical protein
MIAISEYGGVFKQDGAVAPCAALRDKILATITPLTFQKWSNDV